MPAPIKISEVSELAIKLGGSIDFGGAFPVLAATSGSDSYLVTAPITVTEVWHTPIGSLVADDTATLAIDGGGNALLAAPADLTGGVVDTAVSAGLSAAPGVLDLEPGDIIRPSIAYGALTTGEAVLVTIAFVLR